MPDDQPVLVLISVDPRQSHRANEAMRIGLGIVSGENDAVAAPEDSRELAAGLSSCELQFLRDCDHFPMNEQPEAFAALVNTFAASLRVVGDRALESAG